MKEMTWIVDVATGALTVEGLSDGDFTRLASDLLPHPQHVNCARPVGVPPIKDNVTTSSMAEDERLRIFRIYHHSVVEGPGRRSVVQFSGCNRRCPGCHAFEAFARDSGALLSVAETVELLLASDGEPRDGVTILGGEPFLQPDGLAALMRELKKRDQHITLYSGYTIEELRARPEPSVHEALALADILIDGPFVSSLANGAGEWRGSTNQRIIYDPASYQMEGS
jgi:anaerobic ribonucleoside-triphosphate reductase activating protein